MSNIIGDINNELNIISAKNRETEESSLSYIKYYNQVEQPPQVMNSKFPPLKINPLVYWNGFYIQPYRITDLTDLIKERKIFHNDKIITDINEISEYIFAYKEGFALGYEKFDSIEIENKSFVFKSDKLSIEKNLNYIENHKESGNGGFSFHSYTESKDFFSGKTKCAFKQQNGTCSELQGDQPINICEWCDLKVLPVLNRWKSKGIEGGKYYRAWFNVLANYQIFDEYYKSKMNPALDEVGIAQPKVKIPALKDNMEDKEKAQKILFVLSGYWINKEKIMNDADYTKVIEGIFYLIDNGEVKPIDKPIKQKTPMQFIRKLFRKLNYDLYGRSIKDCFIEFLHTYFDCFSESEISTTKQHFNEYKNGDFEKDYNTVLESIKK